MKHSVEDGKYTIVFDEKTGDLRAERYGKEWRSLTGDGMVLAMLQEIDRLKTELERQSGSGTPSGKQPFITALVFSRDIVGGIKEINIPTDFGLYYNSNEALGGAMVRGNSIYPSGDGYSLETGGALPKPYRISELSVKIMAQEYGLLPK